MSGAVGSRPSLTRSCRASRSASSSLRSRPPFGRASTAFRVRNAAASREAFGIRPNASVVPAASRRPRIPSFAAARPPSPPHERRERIRQRHAAVRGPAAQAAAGAEAAPARRPRAADGARDRLDVFGMMMAVASDLPDLENRKEYQDARNSVLYDYTGTKSLGVLTNNQSRVLVTYDQI